MLYNMLAGIVTITSHGDGEIATRRNTQFASVPIIYTYQLPTYYLLYLLSTVRVGPRQLIRAYIFLSLKRPLRYNILPILFWKMNRKEKLP